MGAAMKQRFEVEGLYALGSMAVGADLLDLICLGPYILAILGLHMIGAWSMANLTAYVLQVRGLAFVLEASGLAISGRMAAVTLPDFLVGKVIAHLFYCRKRVRFLGILGVALILLFMALGTHLGAHIGGCMRSDGKTCETDR